MTRFLFKGLNLDKIKTFIKKVCFLGSIRLPRFLCSLCSTSSLATEISRCLGYLFQTWVWQQLPLLKPRPDNTGRFIFPLFFFCFFNSILIECNLRQHREIIISCLLWNSALMSFCLIRGLIIRHPCLSSRYRFSLERSTVYLIQTFCSS